MRNERTASIASSSTAMQKPPLSRTARRMRKSPTAAGTLIPIADLVYASSTRVANSSPASYLVLEPHKKFASQRRITQHVWPSGHDDSLLFQWTIDESVQRELPEIAYRIHDRCAPRRLNGHHPRELRPRIDEANLHQLSECFPHANETCTAAGRIENNAR